MTYGFALTQQLELFLYSLGFGFLLGLLYRFIMAAREEISDKKGAVVAADIIFCVVTTVLVFCFLLVYADGQVRLIALFANAVGFTLYILTFDFILKKLLTYPIRLIISLFKLIVKPFSVLFHTSVRLVAAANEKIRKTKQEKVKDKKEVDQAKKTRKQRKKKTKKKV